MERLNGWSLGKRLGIGFGLVVAVFLLALGLTLVYSASAQNAWKQTERWQAATKGATDQVHGTEVQMMAQANLVATMDPSTGPAVVSSGSAGVRGQRGDDGLGRPDRRLGGAPQADRRRARDGDLAVPDLGRLSG